jgi:hypothetical protein
MVTAERSGFQYLFFKTMTKRTVLPRWSPYPKVSRSVQARYLSAVESAFGSEIDYAMLMKIYGTTGTEGKGAEVRYSPAQCMGARKTLISGMPEVRHVSTSHTERQNLSMRMGMRRFTRLTNAFSKKLENHKHAVALYFMYYNFARIHQTLRVTLAMEAGIANHVWSLEEIVSLIAQ